MVQELKAYDVPNFRHIMHMNKVTMFDFEITYPRNFKSLLPIDVRLAIFHHFKGMTDYWIRKIYGNKIYLDWITDTRSQAGGYWTVCRVGK